MIYKFSYTTILFLFIFSITTEAQSVWTKSNLSSFREAPEVDKMILPAHYLAYELSFEDIKVLLKNAPSEKDKKNGTAGTIISLPLPDGTFEKFEMYDSPVMAPLLASKYKSIKSYKGRSLNTPGMNVRFDTGPYGFHAAIHAHDDIYYIDPYVRGNIDEYLTYNVKDQLSQMDITGPICGSHEEESITQKAESLSSTRNSDPVSLRVYRLALSCTGEWGSIRGTVENALADMNTGLNRLNQIFENELALRLELIEETEQLIHLDSQIDPYINVDSGSAMINANTNITNNRVGSDAYDIGHLYSTSCDVGGVAFLGSMCRLSSKAGAVTCHYSFNLNFMAASVTAHEIGHQMDAQHTFNNCEGNETYSNAYEPGSGSTIMSYSGLCNVNNVVEDGNGGYYYHVASLKQIYNHTRNGIASFCGEEIETSNLEPTVNILHDNDFYIPENTYFYLEGNGEDENEEDELTYCWEQYNVGNSLDGGSLLGFPIGDAPHFRSLPPTTSPIRYFPSPDNILDNSTDITEVLFEGDRTVNFILTVRDNNAEAGTAVWEDVQFYVVDTPVKFEVTSQNTSQTYEAGDEIDVTWNVAGTDLPPVSQNFVDILLFTGTQSDFDLKNTTLLAKNVFNSGSCKVIVPNLTTTRGRIIVKASESNFFSINTRNVTIVPASSSKLIINPEPQAQISCAPDDIFTFEFNSQNLSGIEGDVTYTILGGLPTGATFNFEPETAEIGTSSTLTLDPTDEPVASDHVIVIGAITGSMDTFTRHIYLNIRSTDHSALDALQPQKNAVGISISDPLTFSWSASPNALFYEFELSKSPSFGSTNLVSASGLTSLFYQTQFFFEKNAIYYWRVTASNYCGDDPDVKTFAFATESLFCKDISPDEGVLPINISGSGKPIIQAPIDVNISGEVADINVKQFFGEHENNKDMIVTLISPEDKEVDLVRNICEQSNFNCAFDDDSNVPVKCPLSNGSTYRPVESLSNFNGDELNGEWLFQIEDTKSGNGGRLEGVIIQFCSNQSLDNPYIVNNEKITIPLESTVTISSNRLKVDDDNNSSSELVYTIVNLPKTGLLTYEGDDVNVGDQFSQEDIDDNKLEYTSSTQDLSTFFAFTVIDGEGGFIGVTNFDIEISSTTSTNDLQTKDEIKLYPIPARNMITIDFSKVGQKYTSYEVFNLQGQVMTNGMLNNGEIINLDISQLNTGLYIINFRSNQSLVSKKIIVN